MVIDDYVIAKVCHEVNRVYCESIGDTSQLMWEDAPQWQRESAIRGVSYKRHNPESSPESLHENWVKVKVEQGWKYGELKSETMKTHPCMVPYNMLPVDQKTKDYLFNAVVDCFYGD